MRTILGTSALAAASFAAPVVSATEAPARQPTTEVAPALQKVPLYLKLHDGNLLRIDQVGENIRLYVTRSGYAEKGAEVGFLGFGGGTDTPDANVFIRLNELEALAFVDNDWQKIYDHATREQKDNPASVAPEVILKVLKPLVTEVPGVKYRTNVSTFMGFDTSVVLKPAKDSLDLETWDLSDFDFPTAKASPMPLKPSEWRPRQSESVYLRLSLDEDVLLRMTEIDGQLHFYKTSSGYAVSGTKLQAFGVGAGQETVQGNLYFEISPGMAKAYVDGNWRKLYEAARTQWRIIEYSVSPSLVKEVFAPGAKDEPDASAATKPAAEESTNKKESSPPR